MITAITGLAIILLDLFVLQVSPKEPEHVGDCLFYLVVVAAIGVGLIIYGLIEFFA